MVSLGLRLEDFVPEAGELSVKGSSHRRFPVRERTSREMYGWESYVSLVPTNSTVNQQIVIRWLGDITITIGTPLSTGDLPTMTRRRKNEEAREMGGWKSRRLDDRH